MIFHGRELVQHASDAAAVASVPINIALWVADLDFVLRLLVSAGSLVLIGLAIAAKLRHLRRPDTR